MNNSRLKHSTLGFLKIFFERNNKFNDTFSNLGNVFKNSKWSDLKTQNIKNSLITQYFYLWFLIVLLCSFLFFYKLQFILESFIFLKRTFTLFFQSITFFIGSYILLFNFFKNKFIYNNEKKLVKQVFNNDISLTNTSYPTFNNNVNYSHWNNYNLKILNLYKTLHKINIFKNNEYLNNFYLKDNNSNSTVFNLFHKLSKNTSKLYITDLDFSFILNNKIKNFNKISNFSFTPSDINLNFLNKPDLNLFSFNFTNSVNLIKQERWFIKNSFLTNDISNLNQKYNESKKYINFFFNDAGITSKNIWISNFYNSENIELGNNNFNLNFLKNLNFYDTSTEFFFKRNLNFLSNRNLFFIKNFNMSNSDKKNNLETYSTYHFIYNKYLRSLTLNQNNLLLTYKDISSNLVTNNSLDTDLDYKLSQNFIINQNSLSILTTLVNTELTNKYKFSQNRNF